MSLLIFITSAGALLLFGWVAFPELLYSSRSQPIAFNHKVHAKITDSGCESCHFFRENGRFSGIPSIALCKTCHRKVEKQGRNEAVFINDFVKKDLEIPWQVYSKQPDSVFFSHAAHVKTAKLECDTCHGGLGQSTVPKKYSENILTGYSRDIWGRAIFKPAFLGKKSWESMRMDDCADCHHKKGHAATSVQTQKEGCFVCHK